MQILTNKMTIKNIVEEKMRKILTFRVEIEG